ncbi:MAG: c-type cytochrome, partial [Vicingaceae bacterium]
GIGPVANLELPAINDSLMKVGMNLFKTKCSECHTMEFKNSGPDISDLLYTKKPEWFMNFMLNKNEMLKRDASAIKTRANYQTDCGAAIHSESDARELLEYLRIYQIWLHEFNTK